MPPSLGAKSEQFGKAERGVAASIAVPAPCWCLDMPRAPMKGTTQLPCSEALGVWGAKRPHTLVAKSQSTTTSAPHSGA
ncbi:MAG: hypothetical protein HFE79_12435 [Ruminiclostridium sp.]|nr:hypothetical protein [Ruminiclostridium sp.]